MCSVRASVRIAALDGLDHLQAISAGTSLPATEITPRPPTAISGSVMRVVAAQHDEVRRAFAQISVICEMLPDASFTRDDVRDRRRAARAWRGSTLQPVRPGTL